MRAEAVSAARDGGEAVLTAPVQLAPDDRAGVLAVVPVYRPGLPTATAQQRQAAFAGALTVGHFADVLLDHVARKLPPNTRVSLSDGGRMLAQTDPPPAVADNGAATTVAIAGRQWTVHARHPDRASLTNVWWIIGVGAGISAAVAWALRQSVRHTDRLLAARDQLANLVATIQQGSLRPPPEPPPGTEIAVRYLPAAEHARLGGDWYDIFPGTDGRMVITVGDVSGHGVAAITHMQQVRQVVAAFAHEGHTPCSVLRLSDEVLATDQSADGHFATVWIGYWDPGSGTLDYASAGHPPALLAAPSGDPIELVSGDGPPLNMPIPGCSWNDYCAALACGSRLLVYTDGLVESRTGGFDAGVPAARTLIADRDIALGELADHLMDSRPNPGRDDAALVLVHTRPSQEERPDEPAKKSNG